MSQRVNAQVTITMHRLQLPVLRGVIPHTKLQNSLAGPVSSMV